MCKYEPADVLINWANKNPLVEKLIAGVVSQSRGKLSVFFTIISRLSEFRYPVQKVEVVYIL